MNKINDEPISSQLVILRNVKEDSTEQFNKKGYPIFSSNWIDLTYMSPIQMIECWLMC